MPDTDHSTDESTGDNHVDGNRAAHNRADDHRLARRLADESGALLLDLRRRFGFADPGALRTAGDRESHLLLMRRLAELAPGDAVLSEEGADDHARLDAERVWIVDPLDGTREYAEQGRADWAVHVALWVSGRLVAGAVALPAAGVTLGTDDPPRLSPLVDRPMRIVASRTRAPQLVQDLVSAVSGEVVPLGSAGAKVASVLRGETDAYVHAGGQYEWDSAAPVVVARAAGAVTTRLDGSELVYNRADPMLPDLVVCRPELAETIARELWELGVPQHTPRPDGRADQ